MTDQVLLLAPSGGYGGGIERYVSTVEAALARHGVPYRRLDLRGPHRPERFGAKVRFVGEVVRAVRASPGPVRLVLAHANLLPVVRLVGRLASFRDAAVILHGCELWAGRRVRRQRLLRRPDVRVVAGSHFSAGALARTCHAGVLHPGVSADWYDLLVDAGSRPRPASGELHLVTAFRLADWWGKGLDILLRAVDLLGDPRVRVTVCGSGPVPDELRGHVASYPWCRIAPDLTDQALAAEFAGADLFVLSTRTRHGRHAHGEGFGLVLLEAQLAGTPVVAPAFGGSGEAFLRGVTGLAPVDESPEALATVLARLLGDEATRLEMGRAAADWARTRFHPAGYSAQIVRMLLGDTPTHGERVRTCAASAG